jgi:hypothetical protein
VFPYASPCILHFAKRLRASQIEGSTSRKHNTVMGGLPNLQKHSVSLPSPCVLHCAYTYISMYAHRKSQGSTSRKCNIVIGGLQNPAKTLCFPMLAPPSSILANTYAHRKSKDQQVEKITRSWDASQTCKNTAFLYLAPASYIVHAHTYPCMRIAHRKDQRVENVTWSWEAYQTLQKHSVSLP